MLILFFLQRIKPGLSPIVSKLRKILNRNVFSKIAVVFLYYYYYYVHFSQLKLDV